MNAKTHVAARLSIAAALAATLLVSQGCAPSPSSGWGFSLPDGDAERGKEVFVSMRCNACHSLPGVEQLSPIVEGSKPEVSVALGGKVARIKTYGELVTAVINPSHRFAAGYSKDSVATEDGTSKMPTYNETMTVEELTDIVSFLQSKYELKPYDPTPYPMYY